MYAHKPTDLVITPTGALFQGRPLPCTIGRGGVVVAKREGDGGTPASGFRITGCLFRPDRMGSPSPWAQAIGLGDLWSDDIRDPNYNQMVSAPHAFGHENLRRADPLYDLILTTDWNWQGAVPGMGSAIFLHRWRRMCFPTAGCIAFAPADLAWLAARAVPGTRVVIKRQAKAV
jgi:L,D-peptidoglycan transpeptidase YkuD (ErfK/YbiS/YcfS/YnhG family)